MLRGTHHDRGPCLWGSARAAPRIARVAASLAPLVNITLLEADFASSAATRSRRPSMSSAASCPDRCWTLAALPGTPSRTLVRQFLHCRVKRCRGVVVEVNHQYPIVVAIARRLWDFVTSEADAPRGEAMPAAGVSNN